MIDKYNLKEITGKLRYYIEHVFDHEDEFLKKFVLGNATDIVEISFSDENVFFVYVMMNGQHISDSIKLEEFIDWIK